MIIIKMTDYFNFHIFNEYKRIHFTRFVYQINNVLFPTASFFSLWFEVFLIKLLHNHHHHLDSFLP